MAGVPRLEIHSVKFGSQRVGAAAQCCELRSLWGAGVEGGGGHNNQIYRDRSFREPRGD